jgi:hypothetical protein
MSHQPGERSHDDPVREIEASHPMWGERRCAVVEATQVRPIVQPITKFSR